MTDYTPCCRLAADTDPGLSLELSSFLDDGYFGGDSLLHPELPYRLQGYSGTPVEYNPDNDNGIALLLLATTILFVCLLGQLLPRLRQATSDFFFPASHVSPSESDLASIGSWTALGFSLLTCTSAGLGALHLAVGMGLHVDSPLEPYVYMATFSAMVALYMMARNILTSFVNWVFFEKETSRRWAKANSYICTMENMTFFPIMILTCYSQATMQITLACIAATVVTAKILLLYKTLKIFFDKTYGYLHIFVYFCTLEVIPLLILLNSLTHTIEGLTVKI